MQIPIIRACHKLFLILWMPTTSVQHSCVALTHTKPMH